MTRAWHRRFCIDHTSQQPYIAQSIPSILGGITLASHSKEQILGPSKNYPLMLRKYLLQP